MRTLTAKQLNSGAWRCQFMVDGKRYSVTRSKEKSAVTAAMAMQSGLIELARTPYSDLQLTQAIDKWIELQEGVLSPATLRGYRSIQANHFASLMRRKCAQISDSMIAQAISIESKKYKAKTVTNYWRFIKQVLTWATGKTYTASLPQIIPAQREFLDYEEIEVFLKAVKGDRIEIAALLALCSLRRSEIAALDWKDVDFDLGIVRVRAAMVPGEDQKFVRKETTKNESSRRDVPMIQPLREALEAVEKKTGPVVNLHPANIQRNIDRVCVAAGLPKVGCHGLRHSFASLCEHLHVPARIAMEIGGWSDRTTMERIYTHVAKKDKDYYQNEFTAYFQPKQETEKAQNDASETA